VVTSVKNITVKDIDDLNLFLNKAGNSLDTFRYFSSRPFSVLSNHITTVLLYEDNFPIGYGHLDREGETIWLGICIMQDKKNRGYGKQLMIKLISDALENNITHIKLSVDEGNKGAIGLYQKFGFYSCNEIRPGVLLMKMNLSNKSDN